MANRDTVRRRWDRRSARYGAAGPRLEGLAIGDSRAWICSRASGRVLEVAVGTGGNLGLYHSGVRLTGIDLSPGMLAHARRRAASLGLSVTLEEGDAEHLPYPDASFDTVVCTLALCAVPDRAATLAEMHRVLRPGGRLLLVDHVEPRWLRGRPAELARRQGFVIDERERLRLGTIDRIAARRPRYPR